MTPNGPTPGKRTKIPDNLYTAILAVAVGVVTATAIFVLVMCSRQYGEIFKLP